MQQGRIVKATAGFYYVDTGSEIVTTKPRGLFRKDNNSPFVGDIVSFEMPQDDHEGTSTIVEIHPRKNELVRPPLANIDYMVMVVSATDPMPNYVTIDKMLATLEARHIPTILAITKMDLESSQELTNIYTKTGYGVFLIDYDDSSSLASFVNHLQGKLVAFSGNSGVGKSTLLNYLDTSLDIEVGRTSKKLGRGKHTTRHVEIHTLKNGLTVADTPGFSSIDLMQTGDISIDTLAENYIDFARYMNQCKFRNCQHLKEIGCGVRAALEKGEIAESRYWSYETIYEEIKDIKEWERK